MTASFLFWTGSGYPLATFSLFLSLASVYLTWSFELAWHLWFVGRRFSPFWPHPTVTSGSPENSQTELLEHRSAKKGSGWFWRPQKQIRPEAERIADGNGQNAAPAASGAEGTDLQMVVLDPGEPVSVERSGGIGAGLPAGGGRGRLSSATEEVDGVVTGIVDYLSGPLSDPVRVSGRVSRWGESSNGAGTEAKRRSESGRGDPQETGVREADWGSRSGLSRMEEEGVERGYSSGVHEAKRRSSDGLSRMEEGSLEQGVQEAKRRSRDGLSRMEEEVLRRGYSSEVPALKDGFAAAGHPGGDIRNRRTRSLEDLDVEVGIIRTLSLSTAEIRPASAGLAVNRGGLRRQSKSGLGREQLTEVKSLVSETREPESEMGRTESGVTSGTNVSSAKDPRRWKEIGRGERRLFRVFRGMILLGMSVAMVASLWVSLSTISRKGLN